mgnify:CR=1 FL=1
MNARLKKIFDPEQDSHDLEKKDGETKAKKKRLTLVDPELPPYYVSQFEKNPKGWIWDLVLGFYVLAIIAVVAFIELRS